MPKVSFVRVRYNRDINYFVKKAMKNADWEKHVKDGKIFIKINCMGNRFVPGLNTSPLVLGAVLKTIRGKFPDSEIIIGDADLSTVKQLDESASLWGFKDIAEQYAARFVNLSNEALTAKKIGGKVFDKILVPKVVEEADSIISMPVLKTHGLTKITCSLKNSWGFLPRYRHQYHMVADMAIAEMNKAIPVSFSVVDATICMEGKGPRTGNMKICDALFASHDRVALDTVCAKFMGLKPEEIGHIKNAHEIGIGSMNKIKIIGDKFVTATFKPPSYNIVFFWEMKFRKVPIIKNLFFGPMFNIFSWIVTQYNTYWWYLKQGRKDLEMVMKHQYYGQLYNEYMKLIKG